MEEEKSSEEFIQSSPVPPPPIAENAGAKPVEADWYTMTLSSALEKVAAGYKIHKKSWDDRAFYGAMIGGVLQLHKPDGKFYDWIISAEDFTGKDWIIIS